MSDHLIQSLLSGDIKQGIQPLKRLLYSLRTLSKNVRWGEKRRREPANNKTDGQNWKGIELDSSLSTHGLPHTTAPGSHWSP